MLTKQLEDKLEQPEDIMKDYEMSCKLPSYIFGGIVNEQT